MRKPQFRIELSDAAGRGRTAGRGVLAAGVLGLVASAAWYSHELSGLDAVQVQLDRHTRLSQRSPSTIAASKESAPDLEREVRAANAVIAQLTVPWDRLFTGLASSTGREVALLAVRPNAANGQVVLNGEARTLNTMLAYTRKLERSETLRDVVVLNHESRAGGSEAPVAFSISAAWTPPL